MSADYDRLLREYPEFISKEQMRFICHISKKTARLLLQTGLVPCIDSGKKTRNYRIAITDVVTYLNQREATPEKYKLPENSYRENHSEPSCSVMSDADYGNGSPIDKLEIFDIYPDMLTVQQASVLSGVSTITVKKWIKRKYIKAFNKSGKYYIPKLNLIEFLKSPIYRRSPSGQKRYSVLLGLQE